jgi:hypothetical protein
MAERIGKNGFGEWHEVELIPRNRDTHSQIIGVYSRIPAHSPANLAGNWTTFAPLPLAQ